MIDKMPVLKHREVERILRREITAGHWLPGERLPGEHDLAQRFGVAYMTMRQAVATLVDAGVLRRVKGKGTFLIDQGRTAAPPRTSYPMALLFPSQWQRSDPYYFSELFQGFQQTMEQQGHQVPLYNYEAAESPGTLEPGSAVACLLIEESSRVLIESLRDNGYRVLAINHYTGRRSIPCVRIDDAQGVENAVGYLVSLGHERIGFLRGDTNNVDAEDRQRGFHAGVKRYAVQSAPEAGDGFREISGYEGAQELLALPQRPTAILCASDLSAIGVIKAVQEHGLSIPGDISLVGFGDFSFSDYVMPRLTTVRQSRAALGRAAAESLILLANGDAAADLVLGADLIVRASASQNEAASQTSAVLAFAP